MRFLIDLAIRLKKLMGRFGEPVILAALLAKALSGPSATPAPNLNFATGSPFRQAIVVIQR